MGEPSSTHYNYYYTPMLVLCQGGGFGKVL